MTRDPTSELRIHINLVDYLDLEFVTVNSSKIVRRTILTIEIEEEEADERDIFCSLAFFPNAFRMHTSLLNKCYGKLVCDILVMIENMLLTSKVKSI